MPADRSVLSGARYVAARLPGIDYSPVLPKGQHRSDAIRLAARARCDHATTMCADRECVESWALDWQLLLPRTVAGRGLIDALALTHDDVERLASV